MNLLILAAITCILVENVPEKSGTINVESIDPEDSSKVLVTGHEGVIKEQHARLSIYGMLPNGKVRTIELFGKNLDLCKNLENCEWDGKGLPRNTLRYWIYFNEKGDLIKVDFHMGEQWEQKIFQEFDAQSKTQADKLKAYLESLDELWNL